MARTKPIGPRRKKVAGTTGRARMKVPKKKCKCGRSDASVPYQSASKTLEKLKKARALKSKGGGWLDKIKRNLTAKNAGKAALAAYGVLVASQLAAAPIALYHTGKTFKNVAKSVGGVYQPHAWDRTPIKLYK